MRDQKLVVATFCPEELENRRFVDEEARLREREMDGKDDEIGS